MKSKYFKGNCEEGMEQLRGILEEIVHERGINVKCCGEMTTQIHKEKKFVLTAKLSASGTRDEFKILIEKCIDDLYIDGKEYVDLKIDCDGLIFVKVFPFRLCMNYDMYRMNTYIGIDVMWKE